jgi:hypothetical protein
MRPPPPNTLVNRIVALTLCLLVFSGTLGLGAVWVRQEIFSTANRSHALERQIADVERRLDEVNAGVAIALNPQVLLQRNESMRLGLALPREIQVVRVAGSPERRLAAKRNTEIFSVASASFNRSARGGPQFTLAANR